MYPQLYWYNQAEDFFLFAEGEKRRTSDDEWLISFQDFFQKKRKTSLWDPIPARYAFSPRRVSYTKGTLPLIGSEIHSCKHTPDVFSWEKTVHDALKLIDQKVFNKVVLARVTETDLPITISTPPATGISFALLFDEERIFLGTTPETLFQRKGKLLFTEAVAGTRKKEVPSEELILNPKERAEFFFVRDTIHGKLSSYCSNIFYEKEPMIKKTATLQHLWSPIRAELKYPLSDEEITALLHPTPAVGGLPSAEALDFIYQEETFDRGLYASPIRIEKKDYSHSIVAIRSGFWKSGVMHLFAGAGIVAGSQPKHEWEELNAKIAK